MEVHVSIPTPEQQAQIRSAHTSQGQIHNFCIIAHIDHGESMLADRAPQLIGVVEAREMCDQYLDRMDIEHERGITTKSRAVRMPQVHKGIPYAPNMIDTPGHADFIYEASRFPAACKGAVLPIDAAQGIEAQTLANLYLALENDLVIIPVLNKIDLPGTQPERYACEVVQLIGCDESEVLKVLGKTGESAEDLLNRIVEIVPAPERTPGTPMCTMIFDFVHDTYCGAVTYVRVVDDVLSTRRRVRMISTGATHELLELDVISPEPKPEEGIGAEEVGYLITGVRDIRQSCVGDTVISQVCGATEPPEGYHDPNPMVLSGVYSVDGSDLPDLRDTLERLQLNDTALAFESESSIALGFGLRCGFLGLFHLEIIHECLKREFNLDLIVTVPNVVYRVVMEDGTEVRVNNSSEFPEGKISEVREPVVNATILMPTEFTGTTMELCQERRGSMQGMDYLSGDCAELHYQLPLTEIVFDFLDQLKSRMRGYASLNYQESGEQSVDLVKVDILFNDDRVNAFSATVHRDDVYNYGQHTMKRLKELIPRQQFEISIQATVGVRVIAREIIKALRKDMPAKYYGGDISCKRKLLEEQKEGKKRMRPIGRVDAPQEAFIAALTSDVPMDKK